MATVKMQCLWTCHCSGTRIALFNNLTNKDSLLFVSCCTESYQQSLNLPVFHLQSLSKPSIF